MKRRFGGALAFILALIMAFSMAGTVFAKESSVTFRGLDRGFEFEPGDYYSMTTLFDEFEHAMPGDVLTEKIAVLNGTPAFRYVDIYLKAIPHDEVENPLSYSVDLREDVASMEDFLSQLYMRVWKGDELIYEASPDETDGLTDFVFLGRFYYNRPVYLTVELEVPIDLGNEYANRFGEVDWVFHGEVFGNGGGGGEGGGSIDPGDSDRANMTVHKIWDDDGIIRPTFVDVTLMRDGKAYDTARLNALNGWTYTWSNLDKSYEYEVVEDVPEGYTAKYHYSGSWTFITNSKFNPVVPPVTPPNPDIPDVPVDPDDTTPVDPDDTTPVDPDDTTLVDPDDTTPVDPDDTTPVDPDDTAKPDDGEGGGGGDGGDGGETPPSDDADAPVVPTASGRITVKKEWDGDEDNLESRPDSVMVTLFCGTEIVEEVWLGAHNDWSYTWKNLDPGEDWSVIELAIPNGYTPSYSVVEDGVLVITNTLTLMETGQMKWHIPVLMIVGAAFIAVGTVIILKKRKQENE